MFDSTMYIYSIVYQLQRNQSQEINGLVLSHCHSKGQILLH